jgi:predicted metal-dependent peptidase
MTRDVPGELLRARLQLMLRHPYLASATAALNFLAVRAAWCPTMATDGFNVFVSPDFAQATPPEELIGVVAHEVLHCVLGHTDRRGGRAPWLWNVASDLATNLILQAAGFRLPEGALLQAQWAGMTAEDIYDALAKHDAQAQSLHALRAGYIGADQHIDPHDPAPELGAVPSPPSPQERRRLREGWTQELRGQLAGRLRGEIEEEIRRAGLQEVDWRAYLARFVGGLRRDDYRLTPASRKHLWRSIYLPSTGVPGPNHLVAAIDTSGSMGKRELAHVLIELDALRAIAGCKMTILQCDLVIQSITSCESWELSNQGPETFTVRGRGGTSLRPPFEWIDQHSSHNGPSPDALIYFTDGYGEFPISPPPYPCLWIVPRHGSKRFPFGEVLRIESMPQPVEKVPRTCADQ